MILHGQHTWRYQPIFMVVHGCDISDDFDAAELKQLDLHAASRGQHHMYLAIIKL